MSTEIRHEVSILIVLYGMLPWLQTCLTLLVLPPCSIVLGLEGDDSVVYTETIMIDGCHGDDAITVVAMEIMLLPWR